MIYQNILECVGHTPMVRLSRMVGENSAQVLVKYEGLNVGGSIKTRTALNMINQAEKDGLIGPDSIIVEPTSGNQGIGLALVGAVPRVSHHPGHAGLGERGAARSSWSHYGAQVIGSSTTMATSAPASQSA